MTQPATTDPNAAIVAKVTAAVGASKAAALSPIIAQYGPAFLAMSETEIVAWIQLAAGGDPYTAQAAILAKMPAQASVDNWATINSNWATANAQNAANIAWATAARAAVLNALVTIALSLVSL